MKTLIIEENGTKVTITITEEAYQHLMEKDKPTRWKPKEGEKYWYIDADGDTYSTYWTNNIYDLWRYSQRNVFKTQEEAEQHKRYLETVATIRDSTDFEPDWENEEQSKWAVHCDHESNKLYTLGYTHCQGPAFAYYRTCEEAEEAIRKYKKEYELVFEIK